MEQDRHMSSEDKKEIAETLCQILSADPDVLFAYIFGSSASGLDRVDSDVDVACYLREGDLQYFLKKDRDLTDNIPDRIGSRTVDMHLLNTMPLVLKFEVVRKGRLIFVRDESARITFETYMLGRYFDMKPFLSLYYSLLEERIGG